MRRAPSDSKATELGGDDPSTTAGQHEPPSDGTWESSYYGKSDSATETDLITRSFKKTTEDPIRTSTSYGQQRTEPDSSEYSSQDTTRNKRASASLHINFFQGQKTRGE